MVNALDQGLPLRHQAGDDQAGRCAQVGGHHRSTIELRPARDESRIAVDLDVGAEPDQFHRVHETIFENRFAHHCGTVGDGVDRHELGLHVGREGRVGRRADAHRREPPRCLEANRIALGDNFTAGIHQLVDHRIQIARRSARDADLATRSGCSAQVGAGLDAIRHDAMRGAMQGIHTLNADHVAAGP